MTGGFRGAARQRPAAPAGWSTSGGAATTMTAVAGTTVRHHAINPGALPYADEQS
jgi:hypothetical protein